MRGQAGVAAGKIDAVEVGIAMAENEVALGRILIGDGGEIAVPAYSCAAPLLATATHYGGGSIWGLPECCI